MRVIYATWLRIQCVGPGVHMNFGFSGWSVSITRSRSRAYAAQLRQCCLGSTVSTGTAVNRLEMPKLSRGTRSHLLRGFPSSCREYRKSLCETNTPAPCLRYGNAGAWGTEEK